MEPQYINPDNIPPQLTRDDLNRMSPAQIVQAHDAGQFRVLETEGRDPIGVERAGERRATPAEDADARVQQAEHAKVLRSQAADALRQSLREGS